MCVCVIDQPLVSQEEEMLSAGNYLLRLSLTTSHLRTDHLSSESLLAGAAGGNVYTHPE